jgi:hypothetical protein
MSQTNTKAAPAADSAAAGPEDAAATPESTSPIAVVVQKPGEIGGPRGPEPTRYGDWESKGRCTDF